MRIAVFSGGELASERKWRVQPVIGNARTRWIWVGTALALASPAARADKADVVSVKANCNDGAACRFEVTVRHDDDGWSHYADRFEVVDKNGRILATRVLHHPHTAAPFTRSLEGVTLPDSIERVTVRAHDSVHGFGGAEITVAVERHP